MGMVGGMFPGPRIRDEAGEDGSGQRWRLGPIDLDRGVVEVHRAEPVDDESGEPTPDDPRP